MTTEELHQKWCKRCPQLGFRIANWVFCNKDRSQVIGKYDNKPDSIWPDPTILEYNNGFTLPTNCDYRLEILLQEQEPCSPPKN